MFEIIPGILEQDWNEIEKKLQLIKSFAKSVHIDVIDGKFAKNTTFLDPKPFAKYTKDLFFEVHLMVEDPQKYLQSFAEAGFSRFLGHIEKMPSQEQFVVKGEELGEVGLCLDIKTPLTAITVPLIDLDTVHLMTVDAGFSGQEFKSEYAGKISELRNKGELLPISVDGGMNDEAIIQAKELGANRFIVTSALFSQNDVQKEFVRLESLLA